MKAKGISEMPLKAMDVDIRAELIQALVPHRVVACEGGSGARGEAFSWETT